MATYSRQLLSGSTSGQPILVAATAIGSGTLIHTALAGATGFDEVYLWVTNLDTVAHQLTLGWGGTAAGNLICPPTSIPGLSGPIPIVTGLVLNGGLLIKASADLGNELLLTGFVNRIA